MVILDRDGRITHGSRPDVRKTDEYKAFAAELRMLKQWRGRVLRIVRNESNALDQQTSMLKSMRRILPLGRALYPILEGEDGLRRVMRGIYLSDTGEVWSHGTRIAWEE